MARIHTVGECDADELARRLVPRDDVLVLEREVACAGDGPREGTPGPCGSATFEAEHGPFRRYERTLDWSPGTDGRLRVEQVVEFVPAIPYWSPLFVPLLKRVLPRGPAPGTTPWWSTPDRLSPRQSTAVAAMAACNLVAGLLYGLLTQVLTFISADLGDGSRTEQTTLLAAARLGVVVTVVAMVFADRRGRRRVALWSFAAAGVLTVATAAAPSLWAVGALQLVARNLAVAGLLCVDTIAVEELPAGSRAMVTGLGTLAYGLGAGVVVMTLPLADLGPWGWRLTFVVAGLTLPLVAHAARHLPESRRFEDYLEAGTSDSGSRRIRGGRFLLLASMFFLLNVFLAPSSQLQNDYLRTEHAFSGALITVFVLATSTPGGLGVVVGGRLADVRGRRAAIVPGLVAVGLFNAAFFALGGPPMWIASLLGSVLGALCVPAMGVIAPELFPTGRRGGVRGALAAIGVGGSVLGLLVAGPVTDSHGYAVAFAGLAVAPLAAALLALAVPETRGRELEELNP
ncbi:MAG TPA: MFS transporter [Microthrixaceae bacterium]|nr:MFS transporter [Microthrixaceae bacterium]